MCIYLADHNDEFIINLKEYLKNNPNLLDGIVHDYTSSPLTEEIKKLISESKKGVSVGKGTKRPWATKNLSHIKHRAYGVYEITEPSGITKNVTNLKQYCLDNNLKYRSMSSLANGKWPSKTYKGYTAKKLGYAKIRR